MGARAFGGPIAVASLVALTFVMVFCTGIATSQITSTSSSSDYLSSLGISCSSIGLGYGTSGVKCFVANNGLEAGYGYGYCAVIPDESEYVPSIGECRFLNASVSATFYTYNAGNGKIVKSTFTIPTPNPIPVIKDVINNNNEYSPYLITCPVAPNPTNSIEYISDPQTFIAGNRCLASILPLYTTVSLTTTIQVKSVGYFINLAGWSTGSAPTSASQSYSIQNMARGSMKNVGFSGQATVKGSPYNISSNYDTSSYIFQNPNSSAQQGLWTWTAEYADLRNVQLQYLNLTYNSTPLNAVYGGIDLAISTEFLVPIPYPVFVGCSFNYNFTIHSQVTNIANANVVIPVYNTTTQTSTNNYVDVGNYRYAPVTTVNPTANTCYQQMLAGGPSCQVPGTPSGTNGNWLKIGYNVSALYNSQVYNNLPVYINIPNNLDISGLSGYYGEMIQCNSQNACTVAKYIPQSFANNEDGSVNIAGIEQYLGISTTGSTNFSKTGIKQVYAGSLQTQLPYASISCQTGLARTGYSVSGGSNLNYYCVQYEVPNSKNAGASDILACPNENITETGFGGFATYVCYVVVSSTPFSQFVNINYMVPIKSAGTMLEASTPSNIIAFRNTSIFPYFIYNATIPSTYSQFTPSTFLGLSYSVYSPNNYASTINAFGVPTTPVEPYNLLSGSGLLANYISAGSTSSELADLPSNIGPASSNAFYDTFPVVIGPPSLGASLTIWAQYNAVITSVSGGPLNPGTITATPPTIPQGGSVQLTLSGTTGGVPTYNYNWFQELPGTTTFVNAGTSDSSYYAPTLVAAGTWNFYVQVSDSNTPEDIANTPIVSVTVLQPTSLTVAQGQSTTLTGSVPTTGVNPYTYQWFSQCPGCNPSPVPGATSQNFQFTTNSQTTLGAWQFNLQVTDSNTPTPTITTEAPFIVTVVPSKLIVSPVAAANPTFVEGGATGQTDISPTTEYPQADGSVEPAQGGTPPYNYQWFEQPPGGSWSSISGATATVYTFATSDATGSATATGTWNFKLQVRDSNTPADFANSTAGSVDVQPVPVSGAPEGASQARNHSFSGAQKGLQFQLSPLTVSPIVANPTNINEGGYSAIAATINSQYGSTQAATGGSPPYTYQWMVEVPGSSTFVAASPASPGLYLPYGFTATQNGIWTFKLQVTDNSMAVQDSTTATVNVTGGNAIALSSAAVSANVVGEGDQDILTTTCNSLDTCAVKYCVGTGCTPNINLATGQGHATYTCSAAAGGNICSAAGTFTVDGCDLNGASVSGGIAVIGSDCTGPTTLYVQPTGLPPPVPLPSICVGSVCSYNVITNDFNAGSGFVETSSNGQQVVALPNTNPVTLNQELSTINAALSGNYHGTLGFINITNPAFITESPNGYVYVINYSSTSCFLCPSTTTNSLLFKLKYIPTGDYNYSIYQPSQLGTTSTYPAWLNQSTNYFKAALLADTPSLYIVGMSQFTSTATPNWCFFGICIGGGQYGILGSGPGIQQNDQKPFIPLAAGADYQGDIFLVGAPIYGKNQAGGYNFSLAEISSGGTITVDTNITQPQGFVPSQEFAVSPGGQYVYLANSSYPAINIYSTQGNGGNFRYVGNITLSYSNSTYNMSILSYLANGGPFYTPAVKAAYGAATPPIAAMNDIAAFHHPLAITDVQGILYVVDDWAFGQSTFTGSTSTSYQVTPYGAVWMLRAFQDNGSSEIPLEYSTNSTLLPVNPTTQIINPFQVGQAFLHWPPYGQPLSANISLASGSSPKTVSICEYTATATNGCNVRGNITGYNSIGPQITDTGSVVPQTTSEMSEGWGGQSSSNLGISSSFDGRMYLIIHDEVANPGYAQLLVLTPEVDNYTVQEIGQSVPFGCYISTGAAASSPDCTTANYIADLYPPLLAMPDSFKYLTGQGGPLQYFSIPSALSAVLPAGAGSPGASSYNSASIFTNGNFPGTTPTSTPCGANATSLNTFDTGGNGQVNGVNYNSLGTAAVPGCTLNPTSQLRTYINSTINGYVITPYTITYTLLQGWDFSAKGSSGSSSSSSSSSSSCSDSGGNGQCLFEVNILDGTLLEDVCSYGGPNDKTGATTLYKNWVTSLSSGFVNQTIEGGNLYANNTALQSNYQPNLSDKNLIISPNTGYDLFTNRLLGEIFINQTISPSYAAELGDIGVTLFEYADNYLGQQEYSAALLGIPGLTPFPPKVINATRNYNYTEDVYVQLYYPTSLLGGVAQGGISGLSSSLGSSLSSWNGIFDIEGCASSATSSFCAPAYLAENATPTGPTPNNTIIGANCGGKGCPSTIPSKVCNLIPSLCPQNGLGSQIGSLLGLSGYYYSDNYLNGNNTFNYSETNQTNYLSLFSLFHRFAYLYGLGLDLSNVPQIYGYNRLVYTYVDRFNNTISMPLAVDFANTTLMSINSTTVVNAVNVNQTQINVTGILLYQEPNGIVVPAPVGSTVYLYYDTNMNYFNTSLLNLLAQQYSGGGTVHAALLAPYNKWAENCAFNPQSTACTLANPLSSTGLAGLLTGVINGDAETTAAEALGNMANTVTYQPNYVTANTCPTEPNSLLALSQYNCNIHGSTYSGFLSSQSEIQQYLQQYGGILPATGVGALGQQEYCVPEFSNGTGFLTSQLGLIGTVTTNSAGVFNDVVTACGTASGKIIAQYYGSPGPEPIYVLQPNLQNSNNGVVTLLNYGNAVVTPEYNYDFAPNSTSTPIQIGSYQLNLGNLYAWVPIIIILILLMASRSALGQSGGIFELFGFAALYDMATGIGAGGGGKGKGLRSGYKAEKLQSSTYDRLKNIWTGKANLRAADQKKRPSPQPPPGGSGAPPLSSSVAVGRVKMASSYEDTRGGTSKGGAKSTPSSQASGRSTAAAGNLSQVTSDNIEATAKKGNIDESNYYKFLGLSSEPASLAEATKAYRSAANAYHPDKGGGKDSEARFKVANEAYQVAQRKFGGKSTQSL
jgi:hypothetical protein